MNNEEKELNEKLDMLCDNFLKFTRENQYIEPRYFLPTIIGLITDMALTLCKNQESFESVFEVGISSGYASHKNANKGLGEKHD